MSDYLVDFGPGHVDQGLEGYSADVALNLEYLDLSPSDTRAMLHLYAKRVDGGRGVAVGIELTEGDVITLLGSLASLLTALHQDQEEAWTST